MRIFPGLYLFTDVRKELGKDFLSWDLGELTDTEVEVPVEGVYGLRVGGKKSQIFLKEGSIFQIADSPGDFGIHTSETNSREKLDLAFEGRQSGQDVD